VVGGHAVAENPERSGPVDLGDVARSRAEGVEEWRLLNVGRVAVPVVHQSGRALDFIPFWILLGKIRVELAKDIE